MTDKQVFTDQATLENEVGELKQILTVSVPLDPKLQGTVYALGYPDGTTVLLWDGEDNYAELAGIIDDEHEKPFEVDGVDIRTLVTNELRPEAKNIMVLAEHQRSRGEVAPYGPYSTVQEALEAAYQKYRDGDFDVHGCYVDLRKAQR